MFPVSGASFQMSDGNDLDLLLSQTVYNLVGGPTDQDTPCLGVGAGSGSHWWVVCLELMITRFT